MRISPREAKCQISNMIDIFVMASRGKKRNHTHDETAELIASQGSLLSSFLKCAAGFSPSREMGDGTAVKRRKSTTNITHTYAMLFSFVFFLFFFFFRCD